MDMRFDLQSTDDDTLLSYFRVSTRLERAVQLVDFVVEESQGLFLVQSQSHADQYVVDLASAHASCSCPDWTFRGSVNGVPCKHIIAAYMAAHRKPAGDRRA